MDKIQDLRRDQFTFYRSYYEALRALPKRDQVNVFLAICAYALDNEAPNLSGVPLSVFTLIRPTLDSGRNKARNRTNKTRTNEDQIENKPEQTGKEKEGEGEKEKEGEREGEGENDSSPPISPLAKPTPGAKPKPAPGMAAETDWGFGPELTEAFAAWLRYKSEKRQGYKPEGLRALVTETRHNADRYGEVAVAALIRKCMSANWQGIIWERLERTPKTARSSESRDDKAWARELLAKRMRKDGGQ